MQIPSSKTPIVRCIQLALYAHRMLSKFTSNPTLVALAHKMLMTQQALADAQTAYLHAVNAIIFARVDVKYADYTADNGVRMAKLRAELADGKPSGPIASALMPGGVTPIIKPVGATQVKEMRDLEGRYDALAATFREALAEKAKITALRTDYETALETRRAAGQKASDLRAARNLIKEDFLSVYAEVGSRVRAEFPRDRAMQDLFFDDVTTDTGDSGDDTTDEAPPAG
jgi:hypothetical protein